MGSKSKRRKKQKEKEMKMKSLKKYFKDLKKEVYRGFSEFGGGHGRRKRCKTASELVEKRLEMMDSPSPESSPRKLEKTAKITQLGTKTSMKPARKQMKNNTVVADTSTIIISDSSPTKQVSKVWTTSGMDKLNGSRKVSSNSLETAKIHAKFNNLRTLSHTSKESQVNDDETVRLKSKGHLRKSKRLRKRKKLQPTKRQRTLNRDEEYTGRSSKTKEDQLSIAKQQLKMKHRQKCKDKRIQRRRRAFNFVITDVKTRKSTPDNETTIIEQEYRKLPSTEHNGSTFDVPNRNIVVIDGIQYSYDVSQDETNYRQNDDAFVNGEVHYVDNDTVEKSNPSSGEVPGITNHHNGEVEDINEYKGNNYMDFNGGKHHQNYVNGAQSRECEGEYYLDSNHERNFHSDGRFEKGETHSPEYEGSANCRNGETNSRGYFDNYRNGEKHLREYPDNYRNGETHSPKNFGNFLNGESHSCEYDERRFIAKHRNMKQHSHEYPDNYRNGETYSIDEGHHSPNHRNGETYSGNNIGNYLNGESHSYEYENNEYLDSIDGSHHSPSYGNESDSHEQGGSFETQHGDMITTPKSKASTLHAEIEDCDLTIPYPLRIIIDESSSEPPQQPSFHRRSPSTANEDDEGSCSLSLSEFSDSSESFNKSILFFKSTMSNKVLLLLKTKIYFHGALTIRLLTGNAGIFGYELQQYDKVIAYSLTGHGLLNLSPMPSLQHVENIENKNDHLKELSKYFLPSDFQIILSDFNSATDAILELENNFRNNGIAMIEKYMEGNIVPKVNATEENDQLHHIENFLRCKFLEHTDSSLYVNDQWQEIKMSLNSRQVIIGGKGVGKSTLIRYLINKNLAEFPKILLIDLDVGQSETFLPQTVSATIITKPLLGPGFLQNLTPLKSYFFGHVDVFISSLEYFKCVRKLFKYCRYSKELRPLPWIVNTAASTQGMGLEITTGIIRELNPTDLIQIEDLDPNNKLEMILRPEEINNYSFNFLNEETKSINYKCSYKLHVIKSVLQRDHLPFRDESRAELQLAAILSRLNNKMPWNASLSNVKPTVCASLELLRMSMHNDIVAANSNIINGNLCYLCQSTDDGFLECYGIGLVKGVDTIANNVYLWPSLGGIELRNVNILGICVVPVPQLMLIDQCSRSTSNVPYIYREENIEMLQKRLLQASNIFKYYNSNV